MIATSLQFLMKRRKQAALRQIYKKYQGHTMLSENTYVRNLKILRRVGDIPGSIVECGVWKGGMIAGMADVLGPQREYVLFDSFQGLPPAKTVDGCAALAWQANHNSPMYYNNCTASKADAEGAMQMSRARRVRIFAGWFEDTLQTFSTDQGIAVLRLDGDWYDSTMACLVELHKFVTPGGIVIIDDYHTWDGCSIAVHDFLSQYKLPWRIHQCDNEVCYIQVPVRPVPPTPELETNLKAGEVATERGKIHD
jgi:O-methyltransferase